MARLRRPVPVLGVTQIISWGAIYYTPVLIVPLIAREQGWSIALDAHHQTWNGSTTYFYGRYGLMQAAQVRRTLPFFEPPEGRPFGYLHSGDWISGQDAGISQDSQGTKDTCSGQTLRCPAGFTLSSRPGQDLCWDSAANRDRYAY